MLGGGGIWYKDIDSERGRNYAAGSSARGMECGRSPPQPSFLNSFPFTLSKLRVCVYSLRQKGKSVVLILSLFNMVVFCSSWIFGISFDVFNCLALGPDLTQKCCCYLSSWDPALYFTSCNLGRGTPQLNILPKMQIPCPLRNTALMCFKASLVAQLVKNLPAMQETQV